MLLIPHFSNRLAIGNRMKEIKRAKPKGMIIALANIRIANIAKMVAIAKNSF